MDKKIIAIMVSLLVIAAVVVAFVMIAAGGGIGSGGGFTNLFDKLNPGVEPDENYLQLPSSWDDGDTQKVSDVIVDMTYRKTTVGQTSVYITQLWFVYIGDKWSDQYRGDGSEFYVPVDYGGGWLHVDHGMFMIEVSSATNISAHYDNGDVISLESELTMVSHATDSGFMYSGLGFGEWRFSEGF